MLNKIYNLTKCIISLIIFLCICSPIISADDSPTLKLIVSSIISHPDIINAEKNYKISMIDKRYQYLQWWSPSLFLSNEFTYPYDNEFYDNNISSNSTGFDLSLPFSTGSSIGISSSYSIIRNLHNTVLPNKNTWGFIQNMNFSFSFSQSLNPWWIHTSNNPFLHNASITSSLLKNENYKNIRDILFEAIINYINMRKIERNIIHLNETISLYNELLIASRDLLNSGSISWRDFDKIRLESWEYERELFNLEKEYSTIQSGLYLLTGTSIDKANYEILPDRDDRIFLDAFMNISKAEIGRIEETNLYLMKKNLELSYLIGRQNNAPKISVAWKSDFNFPVERFNSLSNAINKDNFFENPLNNWAINLTLDLSSLLSSANRKSKLQLEEEIRSIDKLLVAAFVEKRKNMLYNKAILEQLQDQIDKLSLMVENEKSLLLEDMLLKDKGIITMLEYKQSELSHKEKQTILANLHDDFWLFSFFGSFSTF